MDIFQYITIILHIFKTNLCQDVLPTCSNNIYCDGPLLHTVQSAKIYKDSKTFVDMKLKSTPNIVFSKFTTFMHKHNQKPRNDDIRQFVIENFESAGQEFEEWQPSDWTPHPRFIAKIKDDKYKDWALALNGIWRELGRKIRDDVKLNSELYSMIWVPNPVIVPGGRFREFYYWDSYWIIQGLLLSEMYTTARGMLENFLFVIEKYGIVPNGGRIYYLQRSQPPLLIPMIKLYIDATGDTEFLRKHINTLEKEFLYWTLKRTISFTKNGKQHSLAVYGGIKAKGPRPESYTEDIKSAEPFTDENKKNLFYLELKGAAESGWDFSSRWIINEGTNQGKLSDTKIRSIIPVDLNAILYWNTVLLSQFYTILRDPQKAQMYNTKAENWLDEITSVLWDEEIGIWLDYDLINSKNRDYFYPSNLSPLFTGCYKESNKEKITKSILNYIEKKKIVQSGGVPTSFYQTGQQWDYPNAWPPLQHMIIVGLQKTGHDDARKIARDLAQKWVRANYIAYNKTGNMYEKYDAGNPGNRGGGGEYAVQLGFGWTNGIILDLLHRYSTELSVENNNEKSSCSSIMNKRANTLRLFFICLLYFTL